MFEKRDKLWVEWLDTSLAHLRSAQLLRTLRPTVWCNSSSEALIYRADFDAWLAGHPCPVRHYDNCGMLSGSALSPIPATLTAQTSNSTVAECTGSPSEAASSLLPLRLFSLNDYLGLASHPEVGAAAARSAGNAGLGPRSSALVAGYTHHHRQFEEELARLKGTEDCLLFPTGFAANLAVMTTLSYAAPVQTAVSGSAGVSSGKGSSLGGGLAIFSDELNHASIIDGARLATRGNDGAAAGGPSVQLHVYKHNDLEHLEELLAATPPCVRRLVVTDSLFSMDGDFADLRGLAELKRRQPFLLAVDEAHATLVCGEGGAGAADAMGVANEVDLHVGTLSKAFGSLGGFVACSSAMKQLLMNRGRAFVYSTSLPLPVVDAAAAALRVSQRESWRRAHVWSLVARLGEKLGIPALSPVVPLVVGPEDATLELSAELLRAGLHVPAIRPPTVPAGTCRLRVSLSAAHTYADVDELVKLVQESAVPLVQLPHLLDKRAALHPGEKKSFGEFASSRL